MGGMVKRAIDSPHMPHFRQEGSGHEWLQMRYFTMLQKFIKYREIQFVRTFGNIFHYNITLQFIHPSRHYCDSDTFVRVFF